MILYQIVQINFVRCIYPFLSTYSQPDHLGFRLPILSDPPKFSASDIGTTCLIPTPEAAATVLLLADYNLPAHPPFSSLFRFCLCRCLTVTAVVSFLFQIRRGFCTTQYRPFHHPEAKFAHPDEPGPIVSYSSWDICALWTYVFTLGFFFLSHSFWGIGDWGSP